MCYSTFFLWKRPQLGPLRPLVPKSTASFGPQRPLGPRYRDPAGALEAPGAQIQGPSWAPGTTGAQIQWSGAKIDKKKFNFFLSGEGPSWGLERLSWKSMFYLWENSIHIVKKCKNYLIGKINAFFTYIMTFFDHVFWSKQSSKRVPPYTRISLKFKGKSKYIIWGKIKLILYP